MKNIILSQSLAVKNQHLKEKIKKIKLVLTDNDGVLTDNGVYYSANGELIKRFSIRDGMGIERLREILGIETGIVTGENSEAIRRRAEKLAITNLYLGVKDKLEVLQIILKKHQLRSEEIAYIGDDVNDIEIIKAVGFSASPADGMPFIKEIVDYVCEARSGNGAFRELAELIIAIQKS
ncbi:MAG TPA: HAD-IIIA family hydrolase [Ignavibacteriaceae bacterium]|nr:HAD-IIIA family hydrolase [Ignavibacteriaceae bacterium]